MPPSERALLAFLVYVKLGPRRSLELLHRTLADAGIPIGIATLKRWSSRYQWQEQLALVAEQAELINRADAIQCRVEMLERQARTGRALSSIGGAALKALGNDHVRVSTLKPTEIVSLIETGTRLESGTTGEARNRRELAMELSNVVLVALVQAFDALNQSTDQEERRQRFAISLDDIITHFVAAQEH
jgi:hypothetical protein